MYSTHALRILIKSTDVSNIQVSKETCHVVKATRITLGFLTVRAVHSISTKLREATQTAILSIGVFYMLIVM